MGKKTPSRNEQLGGVGQAAGSWYNNLMSGPTPLEQEYAPQSQQMWNNYQNAVGTNTADYGRIMGGYQNWLSNLGGPTQFTNQSVSAERPPELGESYGYLREAIPGYRDFAQTGGYSAQDIQELRARGVSPIRSAYSNTMQDMDRARVLGGGGGAPNYIAAASRAQRDLPGQMADALTGVNAQLADAIRQGKLAGLAGISGIGSTMGGLSSAEAGRMLQAAMANQNADLQRQQLSEQSLQNLRASQLAGMSGQTSLYGTTPGMSSMFGSQALQAYQNRINLEGQRNQTGLGLLGVQNQSYGNTQQDEPWWKKVLGAVGSVLPYLGGGSGGDNQGGNQGWPGMYSGEGGDTIMGDYNGGYGQSSGSTRQGTTSSRFSFPGFGGGSDPYLDPYNWGGWQPGGFSGWDWNSNNGGYYGRQVPLDPNLGGRWG